MTACVFIINITCHSIVNGLLDDIIQDHVQAIAMKTKLFEKRKTKKNKSKNTVKKQTHFIMKFYSATKELVILT